VPDRQAVTRVPVEERLFSLVLALLATKGGLLKSEILSLVQGYRQRYVIGGDNSSLERQFERDKDDIRELGVPLETIESPETVGDNQTLRYRIPKRAYDLPSDIRFSSQEITLLSLAGTVWREGSLSADSRRAIMKLRSLGIEADEPVLGYAPRLRARETAFDPLSVALDRCQIVTFPYLKPGDEVSRLRTVAPLALVHFDGRWHLYGTDQDAQEPRTFLLSRIVGSVRTTKKIFTADTDGAAEHALAELEKIWHSHRARVEVVPGSDAEARLGSRYGKKLSSQILELNFTDINVLADEIASFGPEVKVIEPPHLVAAVHKRLVAVFTTHFNSDNEGESHD
jgi:proteasome accessory factor B